MFVAAQKAYEQGLPGLLWFTVPNVLSLIVFAPLAFRIRTVLPAGYTLPEFMRARHGRSVHALYVIQFFGLQICSFAVQILAGSVLIQTITGLSFHLIAFALVLIALSYSVMGGVRASVVTDFVQMALILAVAWITVPWAVINAGGVSAVTAGLGGIGGTFTNPFDPWVAYSFGIPVTIGLLSGPIGDQMHWQRAFALRANKDVIKTFMFGAGIFLLVPLTLSLLGFVAANEIDIRGLDHRKQSTDWSDHGGAFATSIHAGRLQCDASLRALLDTGFHPVRGVGTDNGRPGWFVIERR